MTQANTKSLSKSLSKSNLKLFNQGFQNENENENKKESRLKKPTIKIEDGHGSFIKINMDEFDKEKHVEFVEKTEEEPELITLEVASELSRDELKDYSKQFGITGRSHEGILNELLEAGKIAE